MTRLAAIFGLVLPDKTLLSATDAAAFLRLGRKALLDGHGQRADSKWKT